MKTKLVMKGVPILVVALYAMSRRSSANRAKQAAKRQADAQAPTVVSGTIQKVLRDDDYTYAMIEGATERSWVGMRRAANSPEAPDVGRQVSCAIRGWIDAHESKKLAMAFERIWLAESVVAVDTPPAGQALPS